MRLVQNKAVQTISVGVVAIVAIALVLLAFHTYDETPDGQGAASVDPITSTAPAEKKLLLVLGDSYMEGTGADSVLTGMAQQVATGLDESLTNLAVGGTGYLNPGPAGTGRKAFVDRLEELKVYEPVSTRADTVIVALGINDQSYVDEDHVSLDDERVAIGKVLSTVAAGFPASQVVVIGPWWPNGSPVPTAVAIDGIAKDEAESLDLQFVDPIADHWITGNRETGDGNAVKYIGPDNTHPTQAGHDYIAEKILKAIN